MRVLVFCFALLLLAPALDAREDISGVITEMNQEARTFEISGVTINAKDAKVTRLLTPFSLGRLKVGSKVEAQGKFTGKIEFTASIVETKYIEHYEINARLDGIDVDGRTLNISGITIEVPASCAIKDEKKNKIPIEKLPVGRKVEVEGNWTAMAEFTAYKIEAYKEKKGKEGRLDVRWGKGHTSLSYRVPGAEVRYPRDMLKETFPAPGAKPEIVFEKKWPVVAMRARWSAPAAGWPEKYRHHAVDLILMWACNAHLYETVYSDYIKSSKFTYPPEFIKEAVDPRYDLAGTLRGKEISYEVEARAGFGAADYTIKTTMLLGVSGDNKTVFYHDSPLHISDHLESRDFFLAAHDAGDRFNYEVRMVCVCKDIMSLFRGESMRRVEDNGKYFVKRLYEELGAPPTEKVVDEFLESIRGGGGTFK